jgi:hypothetical protein
VSYPDHPRYINETKLDVIEVIEDWDLGFHDGKAVECILRSKFKGQEIQDLEKALWYLERYLKRRKEAHEREIEEQTASWSPTCNNYLVRNSGSSD